MYQYQELTPFPLFEFEILKLGQQGKTCDGANERRRHVFLRIPDIALCTEEGVCRCAGACGGLPLNEVLIKNCFLTWRGKGG